MSPPAAAPTGRLRQLPDGRHGVDDGRVEAFPARYRGAARAASAARMSATSVRAV